MPMKAKQARINSEEARYRKFLSITTRTKQNGAHFGEKTGLQKLYMKKSHFRMGSLLQSFRDT